MKITNIRGREVYNSRGWPTVQCEIELDGRFQVYASVPTGLSTGKYEARELHDKGNRLWGRGVLNAVEFIDNIIAPAFVGEYPSAVDCDVKLVEMDGTVDKSHLGANTMLAVSMALYRAQAVAEQIDLYELIAHVSHVDAVTMPLPLFNMINGGMHASNNVAIQEFMLAPVSASSFRHAMEIGAAAFHELKMILQKHKKQLIFGDEGGYAPSFDSHEQALDILTEVIEKIAQEQGERCVIALDAAASSFYNSQKNEYMIADKPYTADEMLQWYDDLTNTYPIFSIEDPFAEDDWHHWHALTQKIGERIQVIGDDIFATHAERIMQGVERKAATGSIIKPNQVGTVTEALQAVQVCHDHDFNAIASHRSGDTEDDFIADLAVGANTGQIKAGGLTRSERLAKYNRLLVIEDHLKSASMGTE